MKLKVFTLRLDAATGTFDDAPLAAFLAEREALAVQEHFFVHEQTPTWALLVSYRDVPRPGEQDWRAGRRRDWGAELADEERPAFDAIRRWRNERARREGVPAYVLLTNRQVFEVVRRRPGTLAALGEIEGIGEARCASLGDELLALVREAPAAVPVDAGGEAVEGQDTEGQEAGGG